MDAKSFEDGQLLDLGEDENDNGGNAKDIELERMYLSKWDKRNVLWIVPAEYRLAELRQHDDSQVAVQWGRHRTR